MSKQLDEFVDSCIGTEKTQPPSRRGRKPRTPAPDYPMVYPEQ